MTPEPTCKADPAWIAAWTGGIIVGVSWHKQRARSGTSALMHGGQPASLAATLTSIARTTADALQCQRAAHTCVDMAQPGCRTLLSADACWPVRQSGAFAAGACAAVDGMLLNPSMLLTVRCLADGCCWQADRSMHGAPTVVLPTWGSSRDSRTVVLLSDALQLEQQASTFAVCRVRVS